MSTDQGNSDTNGSPRKTRENQEESSDPKSNRTTSPPPGLNWRILLGLFLLLIAVSYLTGLIGRGGSRGSISYSTFKQQVREDNVAEVTIRGNAIQGTFSEEYSPGGDEEGDDTRAYSRFSTTKPGIEDADLMSLLEDHEVTINAESPERPWMMQALILLLPWVLIFGIIIWSSRRMQGQMKGMMGGGGGGPGGLFNVGKSRAKKYRMTKTKTRYDDVAGLKNAKQDLREIVEYLKDPERFTSLGAQIPKGVLLMGAPGTGKTLLARATAGEAGVPFYSISGSEFIEMFVGVGASRVRDMFEKAKKDSPSIIFIDEIDSIGRARGSGLGGGHDEREQTLNQVLNEMDGFEPHQSVVVIAATNRPDVLDSALTRPGRFDRQITLDLPQKEARQAILEIHTRKVPLEDDVDLGNTASRTVGFSGADLQNLINESALLAGRKGRKKVRQEDINEAADKILLGAKREEKIGDDEKRRIAYHEAGHALVARLMPGTDPLQKVTIIPRGRTLGATEQVPETDRHNFSYGYLQGRIAVSLGGRASEKLIFEELSNGAAQDLKSVGNLARKMVAQWGMSEKLGPVTFKLGEEHLFLGRELSQQKDFSEHTAQVIDEEIQRILQECEQKARAILSENRDKLDALAEALMERETVHNGEIDEIVGASRNQPSSFHTTELRRAKEGQRAVG